MTEQEQLRFHEQGYHFPIPVLGPEEVIQFREQFLEYVDQSRGLLQKLPANQQYRLYSEMHFVARWVYEIVAHPRVLDSVGSVLGENLIAWNTAWFAKMPGDPTFVSWHQDGMYWKLNPDKIVTAWVALSPSKADNGCLRVIPGSHKRPALPHRDTYEPNNALSRGQDVAAEVNEAEAINIELRPGELSLHHLWIVHGSRANTSPDTPRIGLAIRYVSTEVKQESPAPPLGLLVRGCDDFGHFELLPPPSRANIRPNDAEHSAIVDRIRGSIMPANRNHKELGPR